MSKTVPTMIAILRIFHDIQNHYHNTYSWMSRKTIQNILKKRFNIHITLSGVKWHLKRLNELGFIESFPQTRGRLANGTVVGRSTNRMVLLKGLIYLKDIGIKIAVFIWDHLTGNKRVPRGKGRNSFHSKTKYPGIVPDGPEVIQKLLPPILKSF